LPAQADEEGDLDWAVAVDSTLVRGCGAVALRRSIASDRHSVGEITGFGRSTGCAVGDEAQELWAGMSEAASSLRQHGHSDRCCGGLPDQR
jgi:hypothetical protein